MIVVYVERTLVVATEANVVRERAIGRRTAYFYGSMVVIRRAPDTEIGRCKSGVGSGLDDLVDEARKALARLRQLDPALRVSDLRRMFPFRREEDITRYEEALQKAGLPE